MNVTKAIARAKKVLEENYVVEPPVDVYLLAANSGIEIREEAFPVEFVNVSGFINFESDHPVMYVNANDPPNRRKFTVAHELGHWLLHEKIIRNDSKKTVLFRMALGADKDPIETEANAFAAELLVPMDMFEREEDAKSVKDLADIFEVSADVIGYRKKDRHRNEEVSTEPVEQA